MRARDLSDDEQRVLVGLVKLVVHADNEVSDDERAQLSKLQADIGATKWNARVAEAREAYPTIAELEVSARGVTRPEARDTIHRILVDIADADEIIAAEDHVLRWVEQEWGLDTSEADYTEEGSTSEAVETFELIGEDPTG